VDTKLAFVDDDTEKTRSKTTAFHRDGETFWLPVTAPQSFGQQCSSSRDKAASVAGIIVATSVAVLRATAREGSQNRLSVARRVMMHVAMGFDITHCRRCVIPDSLFTKNASRSPGIPFSGTKIT
jgi:hypothetical protein